MKITDISMYLFFTLSFLGFLTGSTLFGGVSGYDITNSTTFNGTAIIETLNPLDTTMGYYDYYSYEGTGITFNAISGFIGFLRMSLNLGGFLQDIFPIIPDGVKAIITGGIDIVYAYGIIQWVANRSDKNYA